jgi:murein DD-endopeptidase MepM/ murein hydrolase activator NlpD
MKLSRCVGMLVALVSLVPTAQAEEVPLDLILPTYNNHLYGSEPQKFYMYTDRSFEGKSSKPWTAGQYGYVRNLRRTAEGVIGTKFHEGVDIRPLKRDSAGRPLDYVRTIAKGRVAHVNNDSKGSNYGKYVVVAHNLGSDIGEFYSLYAHLEKVDCEVGQMVDKGTVIAKLGYTGAGINRERAHLHLEMDIMIQSDFRDWFKNYFGSNNNHGVYNGMNMNGLNVAELFIKHHRDKSMKMSDFLKNIPVYYKITIPRRGGVALDVAQRYPWLRKGDHSKATPSWEISYASSGFPVAVTPSLRKVSGPVVSYVTPTKSDHKYHTKGLIEGTGRSASLTKTGLRTVALLSGEFPREPEKVEAEEAPATSAKPTQ